MNDNKRSVSPSGTATATSMGDVGGDAIAGATVQGVSDADGDVLQLSVGPAGGDAVAAAG